MLQNSSDLSILSRDNVKPRHKEQPRNQTQRLQSHLLDDVDNQTTFKSIHEFYNTTSQNKAHPEYEGY